MNRQLVEMHVEITATCKKCGKKTEKSKFDYSGNNILEADRLFTKFEAEATSEVGKWEVGIDGSPFCTKKCREEYGAKRFEG